MIREHDDEPVPGLPERLPGGETVLWQGAPRWRSLARRAFHVRLVALYFVALAAWSGASAAADGAGPGTLAMDALWLALVASIPIGTLLAVSVLAARTTLYTVTDRRLVLRVGVALPMAVNIPLGAVRSAGLRRRHRRHPAVAPAGAPRLLRRPLAARAPVALLKAAAVAARAAGRGGRGPGVGDGPGREHGGGTRAGRARTRDREAASAGGRASRGGRVMRGAGGTVAKPPGPSMPLLLGLGALLLAVLLATAFLRPDAGGLDAGRGSSVLASADLHFEDQSDGGVSVSRAGDRRVIAVLAPGTEGFIRATLRGLARERRGVGLGPEKPFRLSTWADGGLSLEDLATGRTLDLRAFGPTQVEAFARLLPAAKEEGR